MTNELRKLIQNSERVTMTPDEEYQQRLSLAKGVAVAFLPENIDQKAYGELWDLIDEHYNE